MRRADPAVRRVLHASLALLVALAAAGAAATPAVLDDFREVLPQLQPERRAQLLERATQWQGLTAAQREAFTRRAAEWDALPRAERDARRVNYRAWQALTPDERARLQALSARVRALPADERATLRAQFDALDGSERRDLGMLVYRTPPQQRDRLRRELLSTAAGQRDRWLWERLGR